MKETLFYIDEYLDGKFKTQYSFNENEGLEEIDDFLEFCKEVDQDEGTVGRTSYKITSIYKGEF